MSFLESIRNKKNSLKSTDTVITSLDGKKYIQMENTIINIGHCHGFVVDTKPDNIPAKIVDYIYIGSQDCCDLNILLKYDIKYVLSVGIEAPVKYPLIVYKFVECFDLPETNLNAVLDISNPFIQEAVQNKNNILVHCNAGVSRSASVVIGYLILVCKNSYAAAYNLVKSSRSCIKPNTGFDVQLKLLN